MYNVGDAESIAIFEWWERVQSPESGGSTIHRAKKPKAVTAHKTKLNLAPLREMVVRQQYQSTHVDLHAALQKVIREELGVGHLTSHHMNVAVNHIEVSVVEDPPDGSIALPDFTQDKGGVSSHVYIPQPIAFQITVYKCEGTPTVVKLTVHGRMLRVMIPPLLTLHDTGLARVKETANGECEVILYPKDDTTDDIVNILHTNAHSFVVETHPSFTKTDTMGNVLGQHPSHEGPESSLGKYWHLLGDAQEGAQNSFPVGMIENESSDSITLRSVLPGVNPDTVFIHGEGSYVSVLPRLTFNITKYECLTWAAAEGP
jgi:hypothetical protein